MRRAEAPRAARSAGVPPAPMVIAIFRRPSLMMPEGPSADEPSPLLAIEGSPVMMRTLRAPIFMIEPVVP